MRAALIYPHQLFDEQPAIVGCDVCVLIEEPLLFTQYRFHAAKLVLHRAAMKSYATRLQKQGWQVRYIDSNQIDATADIANILIEMGVTHAQVVDPCDDWLQQRLTQSLWKARIELTLLDDPHFLTPENVFDEFVAGRKKLFFNDFYVQQRKRLGILLDKKQQPIGGKWSYDAENRKKLPRGQSIPTIAWPSHGCEVADAQQYVRQTFPNALGDASSFCYPTTSQQALVCLDDFIEHRFGTFGIYEDAMHADEAFLFHSVLTPALNCGLLSPRQVVDRALQRAEALSPRESDVPLNSLEGFLRQIIGWREYMLGVYRHYGRRERSRNFWDHRHAMPWAFYDGTTGIVPVDTVIRRVLQHAYCHHIERLMILGNFMLLCEIDPDAIYQWFMELFIDAYDWVMVPNVYGMSQHADGGLITTKPYISGSSYVLKMSNYKKGPWCPIWDALYWRFIDKHRAFFAGNPRMSVMVSQCERMGSRLTEHLRTAEQFLQQLHGAPATAAKMAT